MHVRLIIPATILAILTKFSGLSPDKKYKVYDYFHDKNLGTIKGKEPNLKTNFKQFQVIERSPVNGQIIGFYVLCFS